MKRTFSLLLALCVCASCGYHMDGGETYAVSVPYVVGDHNGELTDALVAAISRTPNLRYTRGAASWILRAKVINSTNDRIGYRYDRDDKSGKLRDNLVGIENRKTMSVKVWVEDACTNKKVIGPQVVQGFVDYDYVNPTSLQDLSFIDEAGTRVTSVAFSLGQLDSVGAAGVDAIDPIFQQIAEKIVQGLLVSEVNING